MLSSILLSFPLLSPSLPFSPLLSSCNCKCNPNFLRLMCPCVCVPRTDTILALRMGLGMFLDANAVAEGQRVATLLTIIGGTAYEIVPNLVAPTSPKDKTYTELMDALSTHFSPKPFVIAERYRFHKRDQLPGESIAMYVAKLRRFARHCNFGTNLDDCLCYRLMCGLSNTHIIKNACGEKTSIFPKPFSWLQRRRQPLVMRWSLGRRLSLPRCTSSHILRVDDLQRSHSLALRCGLTRLQLRGSPSVVVALVIAGKIVSFFIRSEVKYFERKKREE